jgi:hypothetical protein
VTIVRAFFVAIGILWFLGFGFAGVTSLLTGHSVPMFDGPALVHGKAAHLMGVAWLGAAFLSLAYLVLAPDFKVFGAAEHIASLGYWFLGIGLASSALIEASRVFLGIAL